jgi:hypothetical protein
MMLQNYTVGSDSDYGEPGLAWDPGSRRLRITVVYTTIEGTLAALDAAVHLSKGLGANIVLLVAEELAIYYPLDHPPGAASFFEKVCRAILQELQLDESSIKLDIHFCRRQEQCFEAALEPRSLVVLGTKNRWWQRRERRLARNLKTLGHDAVLVRPRAEGSHSRSVVQRLVNEDPESKPA